MRPGKKLLRCHAERVDRARCVAAGHQRSISHWKFQSNGFIHSVSPRRASSEAISYRAWDCFGPNRPARPSGQGGGKQASQPWHCSLGLVRHMISGGPSAQGALLRMTAKRLALEVSRQRTSAACLGFVGRLGPSDRAWPGRTRYHAHELNRYGEDDGRVLLRRDREQGLQVAQLQGHRLARHG
jgi:hypothetical protein